MSEPSPSRDAEQILRGFLARHVPASLEREEDFFARGYVSSLFALQLVVFVEKQFAITVEPEDLSLDNFRSIGAMERFVGRKRGAEAP